MAEAADTGRAVRPRPIANRNIQHAESKDRRRKQKLKISERIEIAEISSPGDHSGVIMTGHELCAAQGIPEADSKDQAQRLRKKYVAQVIQEPHS